MRTCSPFQYALFYIMSVEFLNFVAVGRRRSHRVHPGSEEGTPSSDASPPEEAMPPGNTMSSSSFKETKPGDPAEQVQPPLSQEDASSLEQQAPSTGRHHRTSTLLAKLSLKKERQQDK